ncbi:MAG TPA: winged helix-turn-helix domain-containing protein [Bryobacteraceae bacterium]
MHGFLEVNGVRLNTETREVVCDGVPVDLTSVEFKILEVLMESAGRLVSRDEVARLAGDTVANPNEHPIDIQINQLKRKLERGRRLIVTLRDAGYLFATADEHGATDHQLA